jgi:hypothetical protein
MLMMVPGANIGAGNLSAEKRILSTKIEIPAFLKDFLLQEEKLSLQKKPKGDKENIGTLDPEFPEVSDLTPIVAKDKKEPSTSDAIRTLKWKLEDLVRYDLSRAGHHHYALDAKVLADINSTNFSPATDIEVLYNLERDMAAMKAVLGIGGNGTLTTEAEFEDKNKKESECKPEQKPEKQDVAAEIEDSKDGQVKPSFFSLLPENFVDFILAGREAAAKQPSTFSRAMPAKR